MAESKALAIANFVKAASPMGLRRQMLLNNARLHSMVHYFDIQQADLGGKKYWIAWYFEEPQSNDPIFIPKDGE